MLLVRPCSKVISFWTGPGRYRLEDEAGEKIKSATVGHQNPSCPLMRLRRELPRGRAPRRLGAKGYPRLPRTCGESLPQQHAANQPVAAPEKGQHLVRGRKTVGIRQQEGVGGRSCRRNGPRIREVTRCASSTTSPPPQRLQSQTRQCRGSGFCSSTHTRNASDSIALPCAPRSLSASLQPSTSTRPRPLCHYMSHVERNTGRRRSSCVCGAARRLVPAATGGFQGRTGRRCPL